MNFKGILRTVLVAAFAICLPFCTSSSSASDTHYNGTIRVASPGMHFPFSNYDSAKKEWVGFDIDMWREIGKRAGYDIDFVRISLIAGFAELDLQRVDSVAQQISITPARLEKYNFSTPYFLSPYCLTVAGNNNEIKSWADMEGKSIALSEGSAMNEFVAQLDPENKVEKRLYDCGATKNREVALGRADACPFAYLVLPYYLKRNPDVALKAVDIENPIYVEINAFPFARTERGETLRKTVNRVLSDMFEDGGYEELCVKWFGSNVMESKWAQKYKAEYIGK